jgi:hypothetical protein
MAKLDVELTQVAGVEGVYSMPGSLRFMSAVEWKEDGGSESAGSAR